MQEILLNTIISIIVSSGVFTIYLKYFASKSLEYYKKEYQKDLQDYNLYILKRNDVYQELFNKLITSYSSLPVYSGKVNYPNFEGKTIEEINLIFSANFSKEKFHINENINIKSLNELFYRLFAQDEYSRFSDYHTKNSIYLNPSIDLEVIEIKKILFELVHIYCEIRARNGGQANTDEDYKREGEKRNYIENKIEKLKENIRKDIFIKKQ